MTAVQRDELGHDQLSHRISVSGRRTLNASTLRADVLLHQDEWDGDAPRRAFGRTELHKRSVGVVEQSVTRLACSRTSTEVDFALTFVLAI